MAARMAGGFSPGCWAESPPAFFPGGLFMHRTIALLGLALGLAALVLHLIAILTGGDAATGLVTFVTSFAVIANIVAALVYAGVLFEGGAFAAFRNKPVQGLAASAMTFSMLFYHLAAAGEAEGIALIANVA